VCDFDLYNFHALTAMLCGVTAKLYSQFLTLMHGIQKAATKIVSWTYYSASDSAAG